MPSRRADFVIFSRFQATSVGGKVSTFDNPTTLITVAVTVNQNQTKC
ncbi:hypothetical protein T03_7593 [Trichinella britovi]|uniref:Uncharacterized protein n=1 Tax=Trichinella britovi TaxID=45882 RepID=A0A0V0Z0V4_TRIBR|nr:hypothetical protein T03_7593 [Trichinella britovi]